MIKIEMSPYNKLDFVKDFMFTSISSKNQNNSVNELKIADAV
jgi:hypothetical protein